MTRGLDPQLLATAVFSSGRIERPFFPQTGSSTRGFVNQDGVAPVPNMSGEHLNIAGSVQGRGAGLPFSAFKDPMRVAGIRSLS